LIQESLPHNPRSPLKFFVNKDKDNEKNKPQSPRLISLSTKERKGSSGSYSHFILPSHGKSPRNTNANANPTEVDNSNPDDDSTKAKERFSPMKGKEEKELLKTSQNRSSEKLKTPTSTTSESSGESKLTKGRSNSTGLAKLWKKEKKDESKSGEVIPEDDREISFLEFLREDPEKVLEKEKKDKKDKKEKEKKAKLFRTKSREKIERINVNKEKSSHVLSQSGRPRNNSATDYPITNNPISQKLIERRADIRHATTTSQNQANETSGNSSQSSEHPEPLPDKELKSTNKTGRYFLSQYSRDEIY
jgi:hypothetical protein